MAQILEEKTSIPIIMGALVSHNPEIREPFSSKSVCKMM